MNNIISSIFSHEIKNSLASVKFGIDMFLKYEMDREEIKESSLELLNTLNNTLSLLEEYLNFVKFQFVKLKYENIQLNNLLEEIKNDIAPFAENKGVNIYIKKVNIEILNNRFWLKRAIYNIVLNAVKYNKKGGSVNINIEKGVFGIYLSIRDTGIGIDRKKLKSIFKFFERVDENSKGFGVGLALSKSVIESVGGTISVKSNENIGSDFILYIPYKPKEITLKKLAKGVVASSFLLFFGVSYFPIYSQNYTISNNGGYISYKLEDGSVLKFSQNSKYEVTFNKNLYNTKFSLESKLLEGDLTLKAIKNKAQIDIDKKKFYNLGTDFEIAKDNNLRIAVFDGKVKGGNHQIDKKEGLVISENGVKKVILLDKVSYLKVKNNILSFKSNSEAKKYQILFSKNSDFSKIEKSFFTTKSKIKFTLDNDTLYFIKVFAYDENELPSLPNVIKFVNLTHYNKAIQLEKRDNFNEAMLELQNSISTIQNYSSLPYFEIAKLYYKNKNYKKSIYFIKKGLEIKKDIKYYKLLADNYIITQNYKELEKIVNLILKIYPDDVKILYYKAILLNAQNKFKLAQKVLFKLLQIEPKNREANLLMSKILDKLGKKELVKYYRSLGGDN